MNSPYDDLLLKLKLANPYNSTKDKVKEMVKYRIEDLPISDNHKVNMKAIVDRAETVDELLNNLGSYILVNSLLD